MKKFLALLLTLALCLSLGAVGGFASGEATEEAAADASADPSAENVVGDGESFAADGVSYEGESFIYVSGGAAAVGGSEDVCQVEYALETTEKYLEASAVALDGGYNSVFIGTTDAAGGGNMFHTTGTDSSLTLENTYILSAGSQTAASYVDGTNTTVVITDSYLESTGSTEGYEEVSDFMALQGLLVWGHTRTNLSQGNSNTYYYNSVVVADGWAAMSTDGASGYGVNFVAVNSYAETTDGGYAIYSDHECRDYVFGTTLVGAEYGAIIASGGELYMFDGDALDMETTELNAWRDEFLAAHPCELLDTSYQDFAGEDPVYALEAYTGEAMEVGASTLAGGRNAILVHKPDESKTGKGADQQNVFVAVGVNLITDYTLFNLEDMPEGWYTPDCVTSSASFFYEDTLDYVLWTSGPAILMRSCSTLIYLEDVTFETNYDEADFGQSGVFLMSVINSDGNANLIADGDVANPMDITIADSEITGDVLDYDYQRAMELTLDGTALTGRIANFDVEDWNALWGEDGSIGVGTYAYDETYENCASISLTLTNGAVWNVTETSYISSLTVDETSSITTDEEHLLTVTVDGVETDIEAGETYTGDIVINVVDKLSLSGHEGSMADWAGSDYRAALYLDENGLEESASALSAAVGYEYDEETGTLTVGSIESQGTTFNGIIVNEGTHRIQDGTIVFNGDGGNDFNGYGAALLITGENTEVVFDNITIDTTGLVRGAMATANSAKVLVMNSTFQAHEGVLPDDYVQNVENVSGIMKAVPWTLGLTGNNRATNLLGSATSTYFNSYVSADGWGVLSADDASEPSMNVVNSTIYSDGECAYGLFGIGTGSVIRILGSEVDVSGLGINLTSGYMLVGPASAENMADVYGAEEIMASDAYDSEVNSTIISGGTAFRIGSATADIQPGTVIESGKTAIVSKGGAGVLNMDGVSITAGNGIIFQMMDSDDAGADFTDPICPLNTSYTENDVEPVYIEGRDLTAADLVITISNMTLEGDFYNASESYTTEEACGVSTSAYNLSITFENSTLEGVISASLAQHVDPDTGEILKTIDTWQQVGSIVNTARPVINNGVNVTLTDGSVWTVTGDAYLSSLTVEDGSQVVVPAGVTLTVGETAYTDTVITD
ncbi:MAG: hypothetical protein LUG57_00715 [Oscillospiraceae bacterium]|nr:hypothetical protein [Oscillospiraceae bacterium]